MPRSREEIESLLFETVGLSEADEVLASMVGGRQQVMRFAQSEPVTNVEEEWSQIRLQVARRGDPRWRVARVASSETSSEQLAQLVAAADRAALTTAQTPYYEELPWFDEFESVPADRTLAFDQDTALAGPARVADEVARLLLPCRALGYDAYGYYGVSVGSLRLDREPGLAAIASSKEIFQYHWPTAAQIHAIIRTPTGGVGRVRKTATAMSTIDVPSLVESAIASAELPRLDRPIAFGRWRALLLPHAVAGCLEALRLPLTHRWVLHRLSPLELGSELGERLNLRCEPNHPRLLGRPFDGNGWPRRALNLIVQGRVERLVHTRAEALREDLTPPGYDDDRGEFVGATPTFFVMEGGEPTGDELLQDLGDGMLVGSISDARLSPTLSVHGVARDITIVREGRPVGTTDNISLRLPLADVFGTEARMGQVQRSGDMVVPPVLTGSVWVE